MLCVGLDVITIGEMADYASASAVPWHAHAADIISVNIGGGVTRIGNNAFADCTAITKVKIPAGVQSIGTNAFRGAEKLAEVKILSKDTVIEEGAFDGCSDALVLICIRNSKADEYAKAHGIDLSYISAGLSGDSNGDGEITIRDAALILQYIAGWNVYVDETIADANGDGDITIRDAALILQYIAGWDVTLG